MIRVRMRRRVDGAETSEIRKFDGEKALLAAQSEAIERWSEDQGVAKEARACSLNPCVSRYVTGKALAEGRAGLRLVSRSPGPDADQETWEVLPPPGSRPPRKRGRRR
jgi:hypothetical protein